MKFIQLLSLNNSQGFAELVGLADDGSVWVWQAGDQKWKELKRSAVRLVPPESDTQ